MFISCQYFSILFLKYRLCVYINSTNVHFLNINLQTAHISLNFELEIKRIFETETSLHFFSFCFVSFEWKERLILVSIGFVCFIFKLIEHLCERKMCL